MGCVASVPPTPVLHVRLRGAVSVPMDVYGRGDRVRLLQVAMFEALSGQLSLAALCIALDPHPQWPHALAVQVLQHAVETQTLRVLAQGDVVGDVLGPGVAFALPRLLQSPLGWSIVALHQSADNDVKTAVVQYDAALRAVQTVDVPCEYVPPKPDHMVLEDTVSTSVVCAYAARRIGRMVLLNLRTQGYTDVQVLDHAPSSTLLGAGASPYLYWYSYRHLHLLSPDPRDGGAVFADTHENDYHFHISCIAEIAPGCAYVVVLGNLQDDTQLLHVFLVRGACSRLVHTHRITHSATYMCAAYVAAPTQPSLYIALYSTTSVQLLAFDVLKARI